jgi:hypothetical protein
MENFEHLMRSVGETALGTFSSFLSAHFHGLLSLVSYNPLIIFSISATSFIAVVKFS